MLDLRRLRKNVSRMFAALMVASLITGCGGGTDKPGGDAGLNNYKRFAGNETEVHASESIVAANKEFLSKISIKDGIGDFKITPLKFGKDPGNFWLAVENENDFPAGAYFTFALKDSEGEVISAWDNKSRVMAPGEKDLVMGNMGDGLNIDFSSLEITADIREGAGEGLYETVDSGGYKETDNSRTGSGPRIDLHFQKSRGQVVHDMAVLYDSDGNVVNVRSFVTMDKDAQIFAECDYAYYEIYAWKRTGVSGKLPDGVYKDYEKAGCRTIPGTEYESMDGRVRYSFTENDDGKLLICCENETDRPLLMRKDGLLIYDLDEASIRKKDDTEYQWNIDAGQEEKVWTKIDEPAGDVWQLLLHPSEKLIWDTGLKAGTDFYMFPFGEKAAEPEEHVPEAKVLDDGGKLNVIVEWENSDFDQLFRGTVLLVYKKGNRIIHTETLQFEDQYEHQLEAQAQYDGDYDSVEPYLQYYYQHVPMAMY